MKTWVNAVCKVQSAAWQKINQHKLNMGFIMYVCGVLPYRWGGLQWDQICKTSITEREEEKPREWKTEGKETHKLHTNICINILYTCMVQLIHTCTQIYTHSHGNRASSAPSCLLLHMVNLCVVHHSPPAVPHLPTSCHYRVHSLSSSPDQVICPRSVAALLEHFFLLLTLLW